MKTLVCVLLVVAACGKGGGAQGAAPATASTSGDACASAMQHVDDVLAKDKSVSDPDGARKALTSRFAEACRRDGWSREAIECFASIATLPDTTACEKSLSEAQLRAMDAIMDEVARTKRAPTKIRPPTEVAKLTVDRYAFEAYPMWSATHADRMCPERLEELATFIDEKATLDPWAHPYLMFCGNDVPSGVRGLGVQSLGPDGQRDTADDIKSWE